MEHFIRLLDRLPEARLALYFASRSWLPPNFNYRQLPPNFADRPFFYNQLEIFTELVLDFFSCIQDQSAALITEQDMDSYLQSLHLSGWGHRTVISAIDRGSAYVNVKGKITYVSPLNLESYRVFRRKSFYDICDRTREIKVFGWYGSYVVTTIGQTVSRGDIVKFKHLRVERRNSPFNNLSHPYCLALIPGVSTVELLRHHPPMQVNEEEIVFKSYAEMIDFDENTHCSVTGRIVHIHPQRIEADIETEHYHICQYIDIEVNYLDRLSIAVYDDYFPVTRAMLGKTIYVVFGKYIPSLDIFDSEGARVTVELQRLI